jgi:xeroderma pigmentosum group C-complementing protein
VPYLGELHAGAAADPESDYDLWLDRGADVAVDAGVMGNEARFVNDYRGVPGVERPNAEFREVWWTMAPGRGERGMAVFVMPAGKRAVGRARTVGVGRGEEILVSYGKGFWGGRRDGGCGGEEGDVGLGKREEDA